MIFRFFLFLCCAVSLSGLEVKRVILATDENPLYIEFWPVVAALYEKMGFRPTLAFIADKGTPIDTTVGDVIYFPPLLGISVSTQAQAIRLLIPALFPDDGCFISDIDMILISKDYIIDGAAACPDDAFLVYRDRFVDYYGDRYPMCYVAAKGKVFGSIFGVRSEKDIPLILEEWANLGLGWNTDELVLYSQSKLWEQNGGKIVKLGHRVMNRLDRSNWSGDYEDVDISGYIDCHCPRPYSLFRVSIDQVVRSVEKLILSNDPDS